MIEGHQITTREGSRSGFTLVELLVSITVLSLIFGILFSVLGAMTNSWQRSTSRQTQFQAARSAFDSIQTRLSEAELSPYWDYKYAGSDRTKSPTSYVRTSDLHFVSGKAQTLAPDSPLRPTHSIFFNGSFGIAYDDPTTNKDDDVEEMESLLNGWGFFLDFGSTPNFASFLDTEANLTPRFRYRLMELQIPAEELPLFNDNSAIPGPDLAEATNETGTNAWFRDAIANDRAHPIAENIIALIILPVQEVSQGSGSADVDYLFLAPNYSYDSRAIQLAPASPVSQATAHRLPPLVRVTIVALDELSAARLEDTHGSSPPPLVDPLLFEDPNDYTDDLAALESSLVDQNLDYRVFSTSVRLRNSRWNDIDQ